MTREEAIHFAVCLKNNWTIDFNDMEEFCDMAIEALKAKTDGDLISREEVLRMIIVAGECEPDLGYTHLHKVIENLPSENIPASCKKCSNHPSNGGSGICHCILGNNIRW